MDLVLSLTKSVYQENLLFLIDYLKQKEQNFKSETYSKQKNNKNKKIKTRATFVAVSQPEKFINPYTTYYLTSDIMVCEDKLNRISMGMNGLTSIKFFNMVSVQNSEISIVFQENSNHQVIDGKYLVARLRSLGCRDKKEWADIIDDFSTYSREKILMEENSNPDPSQVKMQYQLPSYHDYVNNVFPNAVEELKDQMYFRMRFEINGTKRSTQELAYSSKLCECLGYTEKDLVDKIMKFKNIPEIAPLYEPEIVSTLKDYLKSLFKENSDGNFKGHDSTLLLTRSGKIIPVIRLVKMLTPYMNYGKMYLDIIHIFSLDTNKKVRYTDEYEDEDEILENPDYSQYLEEEEKNSAKFLSDFYQIKYAGKSAKRRICKIREINPRE